MKIAIVGCGRMGQRRIIALHRLGEASILSYDDDPDRSIKMALEWGAGHCVTLDWLWKMRPDAVFICTPPDSHIAYMRAAYDAGVRAIFVEKPLATEPVTDTYPDAITMTGCNLRYHPSAAAVARWLPRIGRVRSAYLRAGYWLPDTRLDYSTSYAATTGATLDVGSHMLDLALDWLGPAKLECSVVKGAAEIGLPLVDGSAQLQLRHDSGATSAVCVSFVQPGYQQTASVYGSGGTIRYSWGRRRAELETDRVIDSVTWDESALEEAYRSETADFLACVRAGRPTPNPVSRASQTLSLLLEARERWLSRSA